MQKSNSNYYTNKPDNQYHATHAKKNTSIDKNLMYWTYNNEILKLQCTWVVLLWVISLFIDFLIYNLDLLYSFKIRVWIFTHVLSK